jgi:outer membrane protein assembly factor BamB
MACDTRNLSALAYANGFTLWHYRTSDTMADVSVTGYFNPAASMLRVGDFVIANAGIGVVPTHGLLVVRGNANGVVDLSDVTPVGATNAA